MERVVGVTVDRGVSGGNGQGSADNADGNGLLQQRGGVAPLSQPRPEPEVLERATRRQFRAEY